MGWVNTFFAVLLGLAIYYIAIRPAMLFMMNKILEKDDGGE